MTKRWYVPHWCGCCTIVIEVFRDDEVQELSIDILDSATVNKVWWWRFKRAWDALKGKDWTAHNFDFHSTEQYDRFLNALQSARIEVQFHESVIPTEGPEAEAR